MSRTIIALLAALITAAGFTLHMPAIIAPVADTPTVTAISTSTDTPTPTATATTHAAATTTPTLTPTATATTPPQGPCLCSGDIYNCTSFLTHAEAQACFDFCEAQGVGDVHHLDSDGDGDACESLPGNFVVIR